MDIDRIKQIITLLGEYPVSEITIEQPGQRVSVRKAAFAAPPAAVLPVSAMTDPISAPTDAPAVPVEPEAIFIDAPMVGVFYQAAPPLRPDSRVRPGQIVGSIESMRVMNDVTAAYEGRVAESLIEDGAAVEYGQALFRLLPPLETH